jgi:hypothetical protein
LLEDGVNIVTVGSCPYCYKDDLFAYGPDHTQLSASSGGLGRSDHMNLFIGGWLYFFEYNFIAKSIVKIYGIAKVISTNCRVVKLLTGFPKRGIVVTRTKKRIILIAYFRIESIPG